MAPSRVERNASGVEAARGSEGKAPRGLGSGRVGEAISPEPETASHAIRVLCVEDHMLVLDGLRAQFAIDGGVEMVGHLTSADDLVREAKRLKPHVVLLDIEMPGADAFELADRLRRAEPLVRIMVLSAHARDSYVTAAFAAGACAYFTKSDDVAELLHGVREVMRSPTGAFLIGPTLRRRYRLEGERKTGAATKPIHRSRRAKDPVDGVETPLSRLTSREVEVLRLIGKGESRVQIATELSRSVKTIDGHQERIMKKLGVTSRADLMRLAIREGLAQV